MRRAIEAAALVFDKVHVAVLVETGSARGSRVERVVGQFLQDKAAQLIRRDARLLLESFDGAEQRPVVALGHFQIRLVFVAT